MIVQSRAIRAMALVVLAFAAWVGLHRPVQPAAAFPGGGINPGPTQGLAPPAARRTFVSYSPDGAYRLNDGAGWVYYQPRIAAAIPKLAAYGFGRYISPCYPGVSRSLADATAYFAPIRAAASASNVKFVPGMWLYLITSLVYGYPEDPPWNVSGADAHLNHPMNPVALSDAAVWDEFVYRARILAQGAGSTQVFVDCEDPFWRYRNHSYFQQIDVSALKSMIRQAVYELYLDGITLIVYHPYLHPSDPNCRRLAELLFKPDNASDVLHTVEHFAPAPYWRIANWPLVEPSSTQADYVADGFSANVARFGFISNHAAFPAYNLFGFSPADYNTFCIQRPGIAPKTWFLSGASTFEGHAQQFQQLSPDQAPLPGGGVRPL